MTEAVLLAPPARLELTTLRLGGARSIQVSYGGVYAVLYWKIHGVSTEKGKTGRKPLGKCSFPLYNTEKLDYNISAKEFNETRVLPHEYRI